MIASKLGSLGVLVGSVFLFAACATTSKDDVATTGAAAALTADSVGVVCRTLGEIGQCGASSLCKTQASSSCKAKASALQSSPDWARVCLANDAEMSCGWQATDCSWETENLCVPRTGQPNVGAPDLNATCAALGELGKCGGVQACKSSVEGVCQATDDAIASDPQWQQMCPRAGTSQEACQVQSNCTWNMVNRCTPRAAIGGPIDLGIGCATLDTVGACGLVPSVCKTLTEGQCHAKPSMLALDPKWERMCVGQSQTACGWMSSECDWSDNDQCVPLSGPRPNTPVDVARACDTFGQVGVCSHVPLCKPVALGVCRATANALAGDPDWANQCGKAGNSADTCGWLAPNCVWDTATSCVPR